LPSHNLIVYQIKERRKVLLTNQKDYVIKNLLPQGQLFFKEVFMARGEVFGPKEEVKFSPPIILKASEIQRIQVEEGGAKRVINGRVVIGAKRMTVGGEEGILSGLGIQDEAGNMLVEAFGFYGPLDLPSLIIASKILEIGVKRQGFVATREEALAAFYLAQANRNDNIFGILGSTIQEHPGVEDERHPDFHPLVNKALLAFPNQKVPVVMIARAARKLRVPINLDSLNKAHEEGSVSLGGLIRALHS
jgi:hypothetical protein